MTLQSPRLPGIAGPARRWLGTLAAKWIGEPPSRDVERIAAMPEYLLYDAGISRDGTPSLARQLRPPRPAARAAADRQAGRAPVRRHADERAMMLSLICRDRLPRF